MHTVLVHPTTMNEEFKEDLPTLKDYMEKEPSPVVAKDSDQLIWHPQSTSVRHPDCKNRKKMKSKRWDHLTFAFLIPDEKHISKTENMTETDNVSDREDSDHKLSPEDPNNTLPCGSRTVTPPPADCTPTPMSDPHQHPPSPQSCARQTSSASTPCDGITIPFEHLIGKLQNLKVTYRNREENKKNVIALLDKVSKQMPSDRFKSFIDRFWDIIQDKLSEGNLSVARDQCAYIEKLIQIFQNFGEIYPGKLPKQKEKFQTAIKGIWLVIENKLTKKKLIADAKHSGSKPDYQQRV